MNVVAALTGLLLLVLAPAAHAQSTVMITLDQAIDLALAHNHALKATRTLVLQNQAQEITANLRPNPTLNFDSQFLPVFAPSNFNPTMSAKSSSSMPGWDISSSAVVNGSIACKPPRIRPQLPALRLRTSSVP